MATTYVEGGGGVSLGGGSTVAFTPGGGQVDSDVVFEWDFDNDGDFDQPEENVTGFVLGAQGRWGRERPSTITGKSDPGELALTLDNSDGRFSYFDDGPLTTPPNSLNTGRKVRVRRSGDCAVLDLTGASGSYASTPDAAAHDVTGDITVAVDVALDDWTPATVQTLRSKWSSTSNQRSYDFQVATTGLPRLVWSPDGSAAASITATATAAPPVPASGRVLLMASLDVDNGAAGNTVTFYYRHDPTVATWIQLGSPVVTGGVTSIFAGTAPPAVGARQGGTEQMVSGTVYSSEVRSGLAGTSAFAPAGTLVDRQVFTAQTVGATSFVDDSAFTWTINSPATLAAGNNFVDPAPTLLARDRFQRRDDDYIGRLDFTAPGISDVYDEPRAADFAISGKRAHQPFPGGIGAQAMAIVDIGRTDCYIQVRMPTMGKRTDGAASTYGGIVYRYQDGNNYSMYRAVGSSLVGDRLELVDVVAGVETQIDSVNLDIIDDMTLGLEVKGNVVNAFLDGVFSSTLSGNTAIQLDETGFGFVGFWGTGNAAPSFDDFHIWDRLPSYNIGGTAPVTSGVLGTFEVRRVRPGSAPRRASTVVVECEGVLGRLSNQEIVPPRYRSSQGPGYVVGKALARGLAIHPPASAGAIDGGSNGTSVVTADDPKVKLLDLVRTFEDHEGGFLYEQPEGGVRFDARTARASLSVVAGLSDAPGAQFGYTGVELLEWREEVINRCEFGIASPTNTPFFSFGEVTGATAAGVANHVSLTIPSPIADGTLCIFIVTSAVADTVDNWIDPPLWWVSERRNLGRSVRQRIYTHISDGTDAGVNYRFYSDDTPVGGSWVALAIFVQPGTWFGTHEGIAMGRHGGPTDPPRLELPWGSQATLLIAMRGAMRGTGIAVSGPVMPVGFTELQSTFVNGISTNLDDAAQQVAYTWTTDPIVNPSAFGGTFSGGNEVEAAVMAIRGYAGDPADPTGAYTATFDDRDSQADYGLIRTLPDASRLWPSEETAEAQAERIFANHASDRPYLRVTFIATTNASYRELASRRRLTEKIAVVADGDAGMGVAGDYHIECISHRWSDAGKLWEVTWDLSPELV